MSVETCLTDHRCSNLRFRFKCLMALRNDRINMLFESIIRDTDYSLYYRFTFNCTVLCRPRIKKLQKGYLEIISNAIWKFIKRTYNFKLLIDFLKHYLYPETCLF